MRAVAPRPWLGALVGVALALPAVSDEASPHGAGVPEAIGIMRGMALAATPEGARAEALRARDRLEALLSRQERTLGPDHLETIVTVTGLAVVQRHLGDSGAAEPLLRRAIAGYTALLGPASPDVLDSRGALAEVLAGLGRRDEAAAELRDVLALRTASGGKARPEVVATLLALADVTDPPEAAAQVAAQALDLARAVHGADHPQTARAHVAAALALHRAGQSAAAIERLSRELARLMTAGGHTPETLPDLETGSPMAILADGLVVLDRAGAGGGALAGMRAELDAAIRAAELLAQGRLPEALAASDAAIDAALAGGDRLRLAQALVLHQRIAVELGDIALALAAAEQEFALREELGETDPARLSQMLTALSVLARGAGDPGRASAYAARAARLAASAAPPTGIEASFQRLMRAQAAAEGPERLALMRAVHGELAEGLGEDHQIVLNVALLMSADLPGAEALAVQSRVAARAGRLYPGTLLAAQAARQEVLTLLDIGRAGQAFETAAAGVARFAAGGSDSFEGGASAGRAAAGNLIDLAAMAAVVAAREAPERAEALSARLFELVQWAALDRAALALVRAAAAAEAADPALRSLARARVEAIEALARLRARRGDVVALAMTDAPASRRLAADLGRETDAAIAALRTAEAALRRDFPAYFDLIRPAPRTLAEVQGRAGPGLLGPDEAMVMLVPEQGRTVPVGQLVRSILVIAVTDTSIESSVVRLGDAGVAGMIEGLRAGLVGAGAEPLELAARAPLSPTAPVTASPAEAGPTVFDRGAAHEAYRALFGDPAIARTIGDRSHWILVPQGPLLALPWNVLVTAPPEGRDADPEALRTTAWLGTTRALSILPTLSALAPAGAEETVPGEAGPYVAFGDPDFAGGDASAENPTLAALPRLPATRAEVAAVSRLMRPGDAIVQTGAAASEGALRALDRSGALGRARVLHFATHGLLPGSLPGLAEPALALAPGAAGGGPDDDGLLTASEIALLDLGADWAFLSACDTGAGIAPEAEGLGGLAAAFFQAGARGLVVSNWAVDDTAAARLAVGALSLRPAGGGLARAEALRLSMADLLHDRGRDGAGRPWSHPALWAPFQVIGTR